MLRALLALFSILLSFSLAVPPPEVPSSSTGAGDSPGPSEGKPTFKCFEHSDSPTGHLDRIDRKDCAAALKRILDADKRAAPMIFSRSPNAGYKLPDQLEAGTCVINIDIGAIHQDKEVLAPMESVVHAALHIMTNCINDQPYLTGLGGHAIVGSLDSEAFLDIVLHGQPKRSVPVPPSAYLSQLSPIRGI